LDTNSEGVGLIVRAVVRAVSFKIYNLCGAKMQSAKLVGALF